VVDEAMELILEMGGEDYLDNFHFIYASGKKGFATTEVDVFEPRKTPEYTKA